MSENRFPCGAAPSANGCGREGPRETACIETNRILDSCRDRDCYENARVYLTDMGQELIENTGQVRVKECCIAWTYIGIDPVQFNRGFYAITIRFFVKLICEACVRGGRGQEFDGIAVLEKQVVLFGGDSNVSVFRSSGDSTAFCAEPEPCYKERTVPTAVVEVVDPIVLGCRVMEPCDCACIPEGRPGDIPESIAACLSAPLACDAMIVDETSMVDLQLMASLLKALKPGCRLLLVGDPDQLPPVGAGNVFSDLIRSGVVQTVRLTEIFRQAQRSLIVMNAHAVNQGELPVLTATDRDFFFLRRRDPAAAVKTIQELCQTRLPKNMGIQPSDIQVLSPSRKHETGTKALNLALQAVLNPPADGKKEKKHGDFSFRIGDRVMQIRNNYDIMWKRADGLGAGTGIFNGDIGCITQIDFQQETMTVQFDEKTAEYSFDMLSELEPAYAMTVHKSQGSEYRAVVLCLCGGPQMLLTRSVLYTAITRARELLIIVGNEDVVAAMTRNDRRQRRYSGLKLRLEGKA